MIAGHYPTHFAKITKSSNHFISMNVSIRRDISNIIVMLQIDAS